MKALRQQNKLHSKFLNIQSQLLNLQRTGWLVDKQNYEDYLNQISTFLNTIIAQGHLDNFKSLKKIGLHVLAYISLESNAKSIDTIISAIDTMSEISNYILYHGKEPSTRYNKLLKELSSIKEESYKGSRVVNNYNIDPANLLRLHAIAQKLAIEHPSRLTAELERNSYQHLIQPLESVLYTILSKIHNHKFKVKRTNALIDLRFMDLLTKILSKLTTFNTQALLPFATNASFIIIESSIKQEQINIKINCTYPDLNALNDIAVAYQCGVEGYENTIVITIPKQIIMQKLLVVKTAGSILAFPAEDILHILSLSNAELHKNNHVIFNNEAIPCLGNLGIFNKPDEQYTAALITRANDMIVGVLVTEIVSTHIACIHKTALTTQVLEYISGLAILNTKQVAIVVDLSKLCHMAV